MIEMELSKYDLPKLAKEKGLAGCPPSRFGGYCDDNNGKKRCKGKCCGNIISDYATYEKKYPNCVDCDAPCSAVKIFLGI